MNTWTRKQKRDHWRAHKTATSSAAQLINQTSGKVEYYTPQAIIEAARATMGSIDLDPASSEKANETVKAKAFFSSNGLNAPAWHGNIWMNHPFLRDQNPLWINTLVREFQRGYTKQFCCITFAATSEKWFTPLMRFAQCYLQPRTNYRLPNGDILRGVTKGSVVTYGGNNLKEFYRQFSPLGSVLIPFDYAERNPWI